MNFLREQGVVIRPEFEAGHIVSMLVQFCPEKSGDRLRGIGLRAGSMWTAGNCLS